MSPALIPISAEHFKSLPEHVRDLFQVILVPDSEPANPTTGSQSSFALPLPFPDSQPAALGLVSESTDHSIPDPPVSVLVDTPVSEPPVSDSSTSSVPASEDVSMESGDSGNPVSGNAFFLGLVYPLEA